MGKSEIKLIIEPKGATVSLPLRFHLAKGMLTAWWIFPKIRLLPTLWKCLVLITTGSTDDVDIRR